MAREDDIQVTLKGTLILRATSLTIFMGLVRVLIIMHYLYLLDVCLIKRNSMQHFNILSIDFCLQMKQ